MPLRQRGSPSPWIELHAGLIPAGGSVLDVACGAGRHTEWLLRQGHSVLAVDRDVSGLADLLSTPGLEVVEADLEGGGAAPFAGRHFSGVICTNYLHRPLLPALVQAVAPGGALLYETFAEGNERFGPPTRPEFLLRPGELLDAVVGHLVVRDYEEIELGQPRPAVVQRLAAVREEP